MFWHAWLAFHQQRHPHDIFVAPQRALHNRIWGHKSSTILFSSMQNNSTDRVRCHPWSAPIFWHAKIKQYAWPPPTFPMDPTPVFSIIYQKIITIHPAELFFLSFLFFGGTIFGQNGLECDSMWNYRRFTRKFHLPHIPENAIPDDFSQKKTKKKTRSTTILWSAKNLQSACILQYVYVPSCGVRCPRWNLWNAKNSEYAWLV